MAKAGFWLRGARGKLAGASMGKGAGGSTVIREIVTPKNPQTEAQMIQRIIMNTIMQAYSTCKEITDHSFEGVSPGAETMAVFMRRNLNALRGQVSADIAAGQSLYDVLAFTPLGQRYFVPNELIISEGSLPSIDATISLNMGQVDLPANTYESFINTYGLQRGDQITFITVQGLNPGDNKFNYARVILDPRDLGGNELPLSTALISGNAINMPSPRNEGNFSAISFDTDKIKFKFNDFNMMCVAVIVSRRNGESWLRSNSKFTVDRPSMSLFPSLQDCLNAIAQGDISTLSDRYLNNAGASRVAGNGIEPYTGHINPGQSPSGPVVTLVGTRMVTYPYDDGSSQTGTAEFFCAYDAQGNNYPIRCDNSEIHAYGMFLTDPQGYGNMRPMAFEHQIAAASLVEGQVINLEQITDEIWPWLAANGVSISIFYYAP